MKLREFVVTHRDRNGDVLERKAASESAAIEQLTSGPGQGRFIDDTVWTAEPSIEGIPEAVIRQNPQAGRKKGCVPVRVRPGMRPGGPGGRLLRCAVAAGMRRICAHVGDLAAFGSKVVYFWPSQPDRTRQRRQGWPDCAPCLALSQRTGPDRVLGQDGPERPPRAKIPRVCRTRVILRGGPAAGAGSLSCSRPVTKFQAKSGRRNATWS